MDGEVLAVRFLGNWGLSEKTIDGCTFSKRKHNAFAVFGLLRVV